LNRYCRLDRIISEFNSDSARIQKVQGACDLAGFTLLDQRIQVNSASSRLSQ